MYDSDEGEEEWFDSKDTHSDPAIKPHNDNPAQLQQRDKANNCNTNGAIPGPSAVSQYGGRCKLPVPMFSRKDFSVWTFLKQCIGKELSKITMPVVFNEPLSFVQRVAEYMEYSDILTQAASSQDPVSRMEYVAGFAVSSAASNWERVGKPFNPLLGETYELNREDLGFKLICEQVSHHPPVSAFYVDSPKYVFHGSIHPKLKFWGKSVEVTPKGIVTLKLKEHNEVYTWSNVICCVHNIIVGKLWIEHYGTMEITNHKTGHKAVLNFKPSGWFGKDLHKIEGYIYDGNKKKVRAFYGKWIDGLYSHDVRTYEKWRETSGKSDNSPDVSPTTATAAKNDDDESDDLPSVRLSTCDLKLYDERSLWQARERPQDSQKYYNFTHFALMLNEATGGMHEVLPPTDSRLRPDIRKLEEGDLDGASEEKHRLEEKQRASRKRRKDNHEKWTPKWFTCEVNPYTKKDDWIFTGKYWDRKWDTCPRIF